VVLRGRALRDATVLRLFAVERAVRGLIFVALGFLVVHLRLHEADLRAEFDRLLPAARPLASFLGYNLSSSSVVHDIDHFLAVDPRTLTWIAVAVFGYAALEFAESVGLWSLKRWGEYLAAVATGIFLPLEIYELAKSVSWLKLATFAINIVLVVYLVWTKRLFGARGGAAAYEAQRRNQSLLEVEETAAEQSPSTTGAA
jgi:uncharacterized membrane protein (DUF2068 family)